jgi:hypothetical protein
LETLGNLFLSEKFEPKLQQSRIWTVIATELFWPVFWEQKFDKTGFWPTVFGANLG